jgi:outer membrane protein assembly factor BamB
MGRTKSGRIRMGRASTVLGAAAALAAAAVPVAVGASPASASGLNFTSAWSVTLPDAGAPIALSSPNVAMLGGVPAVVVGDRSGKVYGLSLANGSAIPGWPATVGAAVDSTPSVLAGAGGNDTVYVGVGNSAAPTTGGYEALNANGTQKWNVKVVNPSTDKAPDTAVQASLAIGQLQGQTAVVAPSLGQEEYAINASSGATLGGFPWYTSDSGFATPALADLYGDGRNEIIEGGDQTAGISYGTTYTQGGHLRILSDTGNGGTGNPGGGLDCQYNTNQVVQSSPAVGEFLGGGAVGIVFGTGTYWSGASNTNQVLAVNTHCGVQWTATLDGATTSSPALANIVGTGALDVIEGTAAGSVYALNGTNGAVLWKTTVENKVLGSVVTADLGGGYQDVLVPTTGGLQILDGKTGAVVGSLATSVGLQNAPLVTDDPNGTIGVTVAGYNSSNAGVVEHFELAGSSGSGVNGAGAWPMFHHDPELSGNAGTPAASTTPTPPPPAAPSCTAPAGGVTGYDEDANDGGVFTYGNLPFCGSMGGKPLDKPVNGMAVTPNGGGYWLVASDGGIFSFGNAQFYGSMGGKPLVKPVVGMASTPDGKGYWMVASDGGIFAFGDARFYGSMGGKPLDKPVVGMASTPDGKGYWMVASDGGIFAFGDATFRGSEGGHGVTNVTGMATDRATGGYWLAASDGGIFSFDAPFLGSMGGAKLGAPVVGIQADANGAGYRLIDAGGGLYCFGVPYLGSANTAHPTHPLVGIGA